ncbi:MAG: hypothetical protein V8T10_09720 [Merdibacter sp.]
MDRAICSINPVALRRWQTAYVNEGTILQPYLIYADGERRIYQENAYSAQTAQTLLDDLRQTMSSYGKSDQRGRKRPVLRKSITARKSSAGPARSMSRWRLERDDGKYEKRGLQPLCAADRGTDAGSDQRMMSVAPQRASRFACDLQK